MLELFDVFVMQPLVKLYFSLLKGFYYLAVFDRLKRIQYKVIRQVYFFKPPLETKLVLSL